MGSHFSQIFDPANLRQTLDKIRRLTMVPEPSLIELAQQVRAVLEFGIPGDLVECGVWRGGAAFLMADVLRQAGVHDRKVWLFDSFEGLPPPQEIDGPAALAYPTTNKADNCRASLEELRRSAAELQLGGHTRFVKGWFDKTLPVTRDQIGAISLLRIDSDWYSSVRCCLENLYDQVAAQGFIVLDDYYAWDGCATAVHEFLGQRRLAHRLESIVGKSVDSDYHCGAVFRKGNTTWKSLSKQMEWLGQLHLTAGEIASFDTGGEPYILVDEDQIRGLMDNQQQAIPFLEHRGQYWGPPADDQVAMQELQRLRKSGAGFIVFGWPAFWWLDFYAGFNHFLRTNFRCAQENDRFIVFDLRRKAGRKMQRERSRCQPKTKNE